MCVCRFSVWILFVSFRHKERKAKEKVPKVQTVQLGEQERGAVTTRFDVVLLHIVVLLSV